ncbi:MAG: MGMT family protein [Thermosphaera sp.]
MRYVIIIEVSKGKVGIREARFPEICEAVLIIISLVPLGKVVSYKAVADLLKIHPRTVANCVKHNPAPLIIPCHRVVHKTGDIGGYSFGGRDVKKKILVIEKALAKGARKVSSSNFYDLRWLTI